MSEPVRTTLIAAYEGELLRAGVLGVCVFDRSGGVCERHGLADWAPPPGAALEDSPLFVGMSEALRRLAEDGAPIDLPAVRLGARSCDFRVLRLPCGERLAVVSIDAAERFAMLREAKESERSQRLADESAAAPARRARGEDPLLELLALFVERAPVAVAVIDRDLREVVASEKWRALYALRAATQGEDVGVFSAAERAQFLRMSIDNATPVGRIEKSGRDGAAVWTRWEQTPWRDAEGRIKGAFVFSEDVTESANRRLRMEGEEARLARLADDFAALARGAARSLARSDGPAKARRIAAALARYERLAKSQPRLVRLSLEEPLALAIAALERDARRAGATIAFGPMQSCLGDKGLLVDMFVELLSNCLRHAGPAPHVYVDCIVEEAGVLVRVTDDGRGVPVPLRARALQFFEQATAQGAPPASPDASLSMDVGMGLPFCRRVMDMHGGVLALDPDWDAGLRIALTFPHVPAA